VRYLTSSQQCGLIAMAAHMVTLLCIARAYAAEVAIEILPFDASPGDIAIQAGDFVIWRGSQSYIQRVEGFHDDFKSPFLTGSVITFSRQYPEAGIFAFRNRAYSGVAPPYTEWNPQIQSHGTISVLPRDPFSSPVVLNAPVVGARCGAHSDEAGNVVRFPEIGFQGSVPNTNDFLRIEFCVDGLRVGSATNWPYRVTWTADRVGSMSMIATAVAQDGTRYDSEPVVVSVDPVRAAVLSPPRMLRPGLIVVDYTAPPSGPWVLMGGPVVNAPHGGGEFIKDVDHNWGRFVTTGDAPAQFYSMRLRF
jgi:hypothetical protein